MPEVTGGLPLRPDLEPLAHPECVICRDMAHLRSDARERGDREAVADCNAHIGNHPHTQTPKTSALTQGSRA
ncbi:hypothetical protein [Streptomyces melanogenes]|uniref:hypothetical protein n=1 Tax=Streptomyces melanogenes TaxID=67326 RepID=UPI00167F04B9|nr:hypothetical protein [Streptomyces melanogenes]